MADITPVLPLGTASLGSPLITPGWPLATVPASNPLAGAPATQTPDQTDTVQGARFQSEMVTSGHANDKLI